jgi:hypothetical protein
MTMPNVLSEAIIVIESVDRDGFTIVLSPAASAAAISARWV